MAKEKYDKQAVMSLYLEARQEILDNFNSLDLLEAQDPVKFFTQRSNLKQSLAVIDTIVKNLLVFK